MQCEMYHTDAPVLTLRENFVVRFKTTHNDLIAYQFQLTGWLLRAAHAAWRTTCRVLYFSKSQQTFIGLILHENTGNWLIKSFLSLSLG